MNLAIISDIANGTEERRLSKNVTELFTTMNQNAVYEIFDTSRARS